MPAVHLGKYTLTEILGQGSYGTVMKATANDSPMKFAVKVVYINETPKKCIDREITALKTFNHPNIIRLHDLYLTPTQAFLVQEYKGVDIWNSTDYFGGNEKKIKYIFAQIVSAVHHMHQKGYVHRDISPGNVLLAGPKRDEVMLIDFGMCRSFVENGRLKSKKSNCGTEGFVAPELYHEGIYDGNDNSDVWSCGSLLHYLVHLKLPYPSTSYYYTGLDDEEPPESFKTLTFFEDIIVVRDLIGKMISKHPMKRCDWKTVMNHAWLKEYRSFFQRQIDLAATNAAPKVNDKTISHHIDLDSLNKVYDSMNLQKRYIAQKNMEEPKFDLTKAKSNLMNRVIYLPDGPLPINEPKINDEIAKKAKDSMEVYKDREFNQFVQEKVMEKEDKLFELCKKAFKAEPLQISSFGTLKRCNQPPIEQLDSTIISQPGDATGILIQNGATNIHGQAKNNEPLNFAKLFSEASGAKKTASKQATPFATLLENTVSSVLFKGLLSHYKDRFSAENKVSYPSSILEHQSTIEFFAKMDAEKQAAAPAVSAKNKAPIDCTYLPLVDNTAALSKHITPSVIGLQTPKLDILKLSPHKGKVSPRTVTSKSPEDMLGSIKKVLLNMGILFQMSGDQKMKCVQTQAEESSMIMRIQKTLVGIVFGNQYKDIRFMIQLNRLNNAPGFYAVNIKYLQGNKTLFKTLRKDILDSLDMYN